MEYNYRARGAVVIVSLSINANINKGWLRSAFFIEYTLSIFVIVSQIFRIFANLNTLILNNTINDGNINILRRNGRQFGLTTRVDKASLNSTETYAIFKLPRLDTNDIPKKTDGFKKQNKS